MSPISRRTALSVGGFGLLTGLLSSDSVHVLASAPTISPQPPQPPRPTGTPGPHPGPRTRSRIGLENLRPGSPSWRPGSDHTWPSDDRNRQVQGFASTTSANLGEAIDFFITADPPGPVAVDVYRLGHYDGAGARLVSSASVMATTQPLPTGNQVTGLLSCDWPRTWTWQIPPEATTGLHVAVLTSRTGARAVAPFVVRDDRSDAAICVIFPFLTYQAYNLWPADGVTGRSLYRGYPQWSGSPVDLSDVGGRAVKVSFDRPFAGDGLPSLFDSDLDVVAWIEQQKYEVAYVSGIDLHEKKIDLARYRALIFAGHDEYWSMSMRQGIEQALAAGTSLVFLTANNIYWHARMEPGHRGRPDRVLVCYRRDDPVPDGVLPTYRWRDLPGALAEHGLLGVQYNGIVAALSPLVVREARHWFWAGCGLRDGDKIDNVVGGEADGFLAAAPRAKATRHSLLSSSPYQPRNGTSLIQNTSLYETENGAVVFVAGTLNWPLALRREGYRDERIQTATANLLRRASAGG